MGKQAGPALEQLQAVRTGLDLSGELVSSLPAYLMPNGLADRKTRAPHTRQRFLDAWRLLMEITRLAAVAAVRQVIGPQTTGEYIAWAN